MIATPLAIMGAVLHIISHSLCKVVLFYIAGVFSVIYGAKSTSDVARIAPHLKFWILLIAFCGASIIGAPLMPGSFGKDYMLMSEWQTHHYSAMIFLVAGSIINILYIYPIIKAGFFSKKIGTIERKKIPFTMQLAIIIGVILALLMSIFISNITNFFLIYHV
jgi:multicomponent Na+:H+ antiporter subunit D